MKLKFNSPLGDTINEQIEKSEVGSLLKQVETIFASYQSTVEKYTSLTDVKSIIKDLSLVLDVITEEEDNGLRVQQEQATEEVAEQHLPASENATETSEYSDEPGQSEQKSDGIVISKDSNNQYRWIGIVSNNYTDRHAEIITKEAHINFAKALKEGKAEYPELWFHHQPDMILGNVDYMNFDEQSGMMIASGLFKEEWSEIAENLSKGEYTWGMSHGMPYDTISRNKNNKKIIEQYFDKEVTLLRKPKAATPLSGEFEIEIKMADRQEILDDFSKLLTDKSKLDRFVSNMDKQTSIATELNLSSKEEEQVEEVQETAPQDALVKQFVEALMPVLDEVKALRKEVGELRTGAIAKAADSPAVTVADLVKQYMGVTPNEKPNPSQFNTPQVNKGNEPQYIDGWEALAGGLFDKKPAKK